MDIDLPYFLWEKEYLDLPSKGHNYNISLKNKKRKYNNNNNN